MKKNVRAVDMPALPMEAQAEIMDRLFSDMHISSDDIVKMMISLTSLHTRRVRRS